MHSIEVVGNLVVVLISVDLIFHRSCLSSWTWSWLNHSLSIQRVVSVKMRSNRILTLCTKNIRFVFYISTLFYLLILFSGWSFQKKCVSYFQQRFTKSCRLWRSRRCCWVYGINARWTELKTRIKQLNESETLFVNCFS